MKFDLEVKFEEIEKGHSPFLSISDKLSEVVKLEIIYIKLLSLTSSFTSQSCHILWGVEYFELCGIMIREKTLLFFLTSPLAQQLFS